MANGTHKPNYVKYVLAASDPYIRDVLRNRVAYSGPDGCWEWQGTKNESGYGLILRNGLGNVLAHRLALHVARRPVPDDRVVDHLCRNTSCVNPAHLDIVTDTVNILRGNGAGAKNARKTHCIHGHEFSPENTAIYYPKRSAGRPTRSCRTCVRERLAIRKMRSDMQA